MTKQTRLSILRMARDLAHRGDDAGAIRAFALCGISYVPLSHPITRTN